MEKKTIHILGLQGLLFSEKILSTLDVQVRLGFHMYSVIFGMCPKKGTIMQRYFYEKK